MIFSDFINSLIQTDCELRDIDVYKMYFPNNNVVNYIKKGRKNHLIHYLISGSREYIVNNKRIILKPNTLIFIPDKTEYYTRAISQNNEACGGIGICFSTDKKLNIKKDVYYKEGNPNIANLFLKADATYKDIPLNLFKLKGLIYQIISEIPNNVSDDSIIKEALLFIQEHYKENLPISEYAAKSALSESYFRKKFGEIMGVSPIKYRNQLRLAEAKRLYQSGKTINVIAEDVGFDDPTYLSKLYKRHNKVSLKEEAKIS